MGTLVLVELAVAEVVGEEVAELVKRGCMVDVAMTGRTTPSQRVVLLEKTQQESVAFGELAAQYEHNPLRLLE